MTDALPVHSLVLYKKRPALVQAVDKKITLVLEAGDTVQVREKDVVLLHPGPLDNLARLKSLPVIDAGAIQSAWELLIGETFDLAALAELVYGSFTPVTAWAAWQLVMGGEYFYGDPAALSAFTPQERQQILQERQARAAEKQAWEAVIERARQGSLLAEDRRYVQETERLAFGQSQRSALLAALHIEETPQSAHAFLLRVGFWDAAVNPYPRRYNLQLLPPEEEIPSLPVEPRRDLTALPAYAIDDASSRDPDDALSLEGERLWVHVADAAALILPDSPLDWEARQRGETLYIPEGAADMVPLSAIRCLGLGLAEISPSLSFGIDFAEDGRVRGVEITPAWVRVTRCTYEEVENKLDVEPFASLFDIARRFGEYRTQHGSLSLDLPEVKIFIQDGKVQITPLPRLRSRVLVQEAMLAAGAAAAGFAQQHNLPMPYSTNDSTDLPLTVPTLSARYSLRRSLKRSQYRVNAAPHTLLGLPAYIQVTSPLRRYLDLVAHQQLRAWLRGDAPMDDAAVLERIGAVEAVAGAVRNAERDSELHWTLVYLIQNPDWQGEAVVVEKRDHHGVVLIPELALEAEISLPADCALDRVIGVRLLGVDLPKQRVFFAPLRG